MQRKLRIYALAAVAAVMFLSMPPTAHADWQYTKWGMSPEEVVAASSGSAHLVPDAEAKKELSDPRSYIATLARASRLINGEKFSVSFSFHRYSKRLQSVSLDAADVSRCTIYKSALLHKYGTPALSEYNDTFLIWRDQPSGNAIDFVYTPPSFCTIRLEPVDSDFTNSM